MRFNPRSPCGGATSQPTMPRIRRLFQPPLPLRGATPDEFYVRCLGWFQPTLPWRGATRSPRKLPVTGQVSTHAPLAGSDLLHVAHLLDVQASTPRSPCGERRSRPRAPPGRASFNPRSPCGERSPADPRQGSGCEVSTHAPLAGSDITARTEPTPSFSFQPTLPLRGATEMHDHIALIERFQPTLPLRGATGELGGVDGRHVVSTHAPPAGNDIMWRRRTSYSEFQPTLPLRGATADEFGVRILAVFQPTLPLRGATLLKLLVIQRGAVSTHAPLAGSDGALVDGHAHVLGVSTHAPLAGSDEASHRTPHPLLRFNPRSPCGERRTNTAQVDSHSQLQPTLPLRGATVTSTFASGL